MKTRIIAEVGVNHNGNVNLARNLIEVASDAGADYVKFQTFITDELVTRSAPKAKYQRNLSDKNETQYSMLKKLELSREMHLQLIEHSKLCGIDFMSTPFDRDSADMLLSLGQKVFKIASGELTNLPLLRHIGSFGKDVILSTGMSSMDEIRASLDILIQSGTPKSQITVLHCTSSYPASMSEVNLLAMTRMRKELDTVVGYSDHTLGSEVAIAAVALGASTIEKHITLDKESSGPDHHASLSPSELRTMIYQIRNIELALGNDLKQCTESEIEIASIARKSIVARKSIKAGETFSEENLTTKRPGTGISPMRWDKLIGSRASRNYEIDEMICEA